MEWRREGWEGEWRDWLDILLAEEDEEKKLNVPSGPAREERRHHLWGCWRLCGPRPHHPPHLLPQQHLVALLPNVSTCRSPLTCAHPTAGVSAPQVLRRGLCLCNFPSSSTTFPPTLASYSPLPAPPASSSVSHIRV
eukprot:457941-Hanusia_phi.AAC.1